MYTSLPQLPLDPIFKLFGEFLADTNPNKVNLGIGLYADDEGKPFVFPSVKKAFLEVDNSNFDYAPLRGNPVFLDKSFEFIFENCIDTNLIAKQSSCGGTQAIRLFADLFKKGLETEPKLLYGAPTWGNHLAIFKGYTQIAFNHLNDAKSEANLQNYIEAIEVADLGSVLLMHGGLTHNPTGLNLKESELDELIVAANNKKIAVFVDSAYLGFGDDIEAEKRYLQKLLMKLDNVAIGISFSKNASLYEHRTGILFVKCDSEDSKVAVESQLQQLCRESVSMSPGIGQEVMANIYEGHFENWLSELDSLRLGLDAKRNSLIEKLPALSYLQECRGMFGMLQLSADQILRLKEEFSVYISTNGRINIAGINPGNLDYLASSIAAVL